MPMVKRPYTITEDQDAALKRVHNKTGIPIARLVRDGITLVLDQHGEQADATVQHGGIRPNAGRPKQPDDIIN